jgi:hypothetical protein
MSMYSKTQLQQISRDQRKKLCQSSRKPTGPKTEASEFEVGPMKIENQEVRLAKSGFWFFSNFL